MEIIINVEDYIDKDQIREMIILEIEGIIKKDAERLLSNAAYHVVWEAVDKALDNSAKELIKEKTIEIIKGITSYSVFRRKDYFEKEDSEAFKILRSSVIENSDLIKQKTKEAIELADFTKYLKDEYDIRETIGESVIDIFKRGLNHEN